jgi:hypothetical protein
MSNSEPSLPPKTDPWAAPRTVLSQGLREDADRKPRLWRWFVIGFLVVFATLSVTVKMLALHPSGMRVIQCRLWWYYFLEVQRASHDTLGPGSGDASAAFETILEHLLVSCAGGVGMVGIAWLVHLLKRRTS